MPAPPSLDVREHLIRALQAELIGPFDPRPLAEGGGGELLRMSPSRWYLTGFLANEVVREADDDVEEGELGAGDDLGDTGAESAAEPQPQIKRFLPASMGMSVLLAKDTQAVTVRLRFADYAGLRRKDLPEEGPRPKGPQTLWWRRVPREWIELRLAIGDGRGADTTVAVPDSRGVEIACRAERVHGVPGVPEGALAASIFVVNRRQPELTGPRNPRRDEDYIFQVELELRAPGQLLGRRDHHLEQAEDEDDRIIDLQYRAAREWGVGHGCATEAIREHGPEGEVVGVRSVWLPTAEVAKVRTRPPRDTVVEMEALAALEDGAKLRAALEDLPRAYGEWIAEQRGKAVEGERRRQMQALLVEKAEYAKARLEAGVALLAEDAEARRAFCLANAAMAATQRKRRPDRAPAWRLFQLAFVILNVRGLVDPSNEEREIVELIFFPTGGGKTEAYLGVIAMTLVLRRLKGQDRADRGLGVAVILRYTLRLLTLDQLGRAAGLICALELERRRAPELLGAERFTIGLWVGRSASPNRLVDAKRQIDEYRQNIGASPFPLTNCPWCGEELGGSCMSTRSAKKSITEVVVSCANYRGKCPFSRAGGREGLPVLFVDEQIYRELPSFIVATVDKFAMLPWRGETGMLFGRVHSRQGKRFFGPNDSPGPGAGSEGLPEGLRPPELIVQDELHLIAGPLGTMVGLYETMIEELARSGERRPKIIAATATVRRAGKQIRALFGRGEARVFPPAGVDAWDTFFAELDHEAPKRKYVGVAAGGRPIKRILINTYLSLLAAAERRYDRKADQGPEDQKSGAVQGADPYMSVVGYFNSLRELGGMRRLVEDEIHGRASGLASRKPEDWLGPHPWFANRRLGLEPVELTSREPTARIAESKERLSRHAFEDGFVDVCLASNMISVGVDIDRLGLMVVAGQPKTTSEYIQASSRVGRQDQWPGLVVTVFNLYKPRDRSHYEHFRAYHENFYRYVESQSLTPFSGPALERGFVGIVVGMTRLIEPGMTGPKAVNEIKRHRERAEAMVEAIASRAARHSGELDGERLAQTLRQRGRALLDSWQQVIEEAREGGAGGQRRYSRFDELKEGLPLLYLVGEHQPESQHAAKFHAPTSMRDVEASVHVWVERSGFGGGR